MNKICTSIEQSKKLIELGIDINTADIYYEEVCNLVKPIVGNYILHNQCMEDKDYKKLSNPVLSPAWSLSALLDILPTYLFEFDRGIDLNVYPNLNSGGWHCSYMPNCIENMKTDKFKLITSEDTLVDACYEMIVKLYELKIL